MWRFQHTFCKSALPRLIFSSKFSTEVKTAAASVTAESPDAGIPLTSSTGTTVASNTPRINPDLTKPINTNFLNNVEVTRSVDRSVISSFDDIPGPHSLRLISKFWTYVPLLSKEFTAGTLFHVMNLGKFFGNILSWGGNAKFFQKFFDVYGPVVRLHGPFGGDVVLLSRPEHASVVFQHEGTYPIRSTLDSVERYRLQHRRLRQAGPFITSGAEWEKLRKSIEAPMQSSVVQNFDQIESACDDFITRVYAVRNLQEEVPKNFHNEILKWALECMCSVTLNRKLGFLDPAGLSPTSDPGRLLDALNGATEAIRKCEYGFHIWKFMDTPAWKSLVKNCDSIDSILNKYIVRAQNSLKEKSDIKSLKPENLTVIENLLLREDVLAEDVMTVLLDMLLIGVNASAHTVAFLIYHLAKSPRCQKKLYEEVEKQGAAITRGSLKKMPFLQACVKESLRLKPPIPILNRVLSREAVIHHYRVPKGTYVLMATHLASTREEYFEDARKFLPERWLGGDVASLCGEFQRFASIPFGYGPKACLAKEMAEVEIGLLLVKMIGKFKFEYNYGEMESSNVLLASPKKPLNFRFVDRL